MSHLYYANKEIQFLFESDDLSEIDYLLKNGLDINSCDVFNYNALFYANFEKTKFLVDRGINIFQQSYYDRTSVMSSYRKKQDIKKVKYLVNKGLIPNKYHPYLLHGNSIEVLEFFIKKYNLNVTEINKDGYNTLFFTNRESAEFMISKGVDPFYKDPTYDLTTLFSNELETLELLISKGVDPFYINKSNENQLYGVYNLPCLKYLLNLGLDPYHKADSYTNLLFSGLSYDSLDFLVNNYNYDINEVGSDGKNLLFTVDSIESIDYLIKKGLNPFVLFDDKTLIEYMPIECIPYLLNMGVHKAQNNKLCFSNKIDSRIKRLIINKNIEDNNINILNKENGNNLLFENINDVEISSKLINQGINLYYINNKIEPNSKSHFISCVNNYQIYEMAKAKGLFNNKHYNEFLKNDEIYSIYTLNKHVLNDLLKFEMINIENILFSEYPAYQTKYLVNYVNINNVKDGYTALLKAENLKKTIVLIKYGADVNYISDNKIEKQNDDINFVEFEEKKDHNIFQHLLTLYNHKKYDIFSMLKFIKRHGLSLKQMFLNSKNDSTVYSNDLFRLIILSNKIKECFSLFYDEIEYIDCSKINNYNESLLFTIISNYKHFNNHNIFSLYNSALYLYYKQNNKNDSLINFINNTHPYIIQNKELFIEEIKNNFFYFEYNSEPFYIQPDLFITNIIKDIQFILFENDPNILYSKPYIDKLIIDDLFLQKGFNIYSIYSNNENILFKLSNIKSIKKCIDEGVDYQQINYEGCNFISKRIFDKLFRYNTNYINVILTLIELNPNFIQDNYYGENCIELLKQENLEHYNYVNNLLTSIELQKKFENSNNNNNKSRRL